MFTPGALFRSAPPDQLFDVIAALGDVVEVGPLELACWRGVQQQAVHAEAVAARSDSQSPQPRDDPEVAVVIDGDKPGVDQRSVGGKAARHGIG